MHFHYFLPLVSRKMTAEVQVLRDIQSTAHGLGFVAVHFSLNTNWKISVSFENLQKLEG